MTITSERITKKQYYPKLLKRGADHVFALDDKVGVQLTGSCHVRYNDNFDSWEADGFEESDAAITIHN